MKESFLVYKLYCTHESNPNSIVDFSNFLWDSAFYNVCASVPAEAAKGDVNTTISPQKVQSTSINRRTKLKHPNKKNISSLEYSPNLAENSSLIKELPVQSTKLKIKCNNEDNSIIELNDTNLVSQLAIDESLKTNAKKSITNILDSTLKNSSDSYNISERTLVFNISAPKGFMDSTLTSNTPPDFSLSSKFNFNPNSVSTPTKKLIHISTDEISITRENINEPLSNTLTLEDKANDTYSVSLSNEESNDRNDDIKFDVTTTISTSYMETGKAADPVEESEPNSALQNTYIFEEATETLSANNDKILANSIENVISTEDSINNKLEESQNFPYNSDADFNSTITIKSKENDDSEEDSCYSSSSNIRSLGDVCDMSQLQPQKNSNLGCTLTKTRSENSLCLPEPVCNSRKPKTYYGSAVNLGTHNTNQLTAERRIHQNPNYFLRCPGNEVAMPNVNLPINNAGHVSMEKSIIPTRVSKIPRLQSKIPKLVTKK